MTAGSICVPQIIPLRVPCLGKNKHEITTNTLIGMKSDTTDVNIYYTLDGSKPELLKKKGYGENSTFKYTRPITLPDGKIQVKAMAVSRDCRESGIVTKIFQVDYVPPVMTSFGEYKAENFLKNLVKQESKNGILDSNLEGRHIYDENKLGHNAEIKQFQDFKGGDRTENKSLEVCLSPESPVETPSYLEETGFTQTKYPKQTNSSYMNGQKKVTNAQVLRINKATNFLKCTNCLTTRPSDPFVIFCQECGTAIPPMFGQHIPPTEGAQMRICVECRTMVPVNAPMCIVCEAPSAPQPQTQANIHLKGKGICCFCGTGNPAPFKHCVTCESHLPETYGPIFTGETSPSLINQKTTIISCSKCGRRNRCDARFCDWCGAQPTAPSCYSTCTKCRASNYSDARYCGSCGNYIEPFTRVKSSNSVTISTQEMDSHNEPQSAWTPASISKSNMPTKKDKGTQTIGLFYPSNKLLVKKEMEHVLQKERQEKMNDHRPPISAISPGKGYWRKQLDHIFAHLRSYAQNNPNFRILIGEPKMGKLLIATVHEDGYTVSIRLNFMQITKNTSGNKPVSHDSPFQSTATEILNGQYSSPIYAVNENNQKTSDSTKDIKNKRKIRPFSGKEDLLSPENRQLLKEIKEGRIFVVEQMLDEGADPNCTNNEDRPSLTVAVLNKHHEAIPILLQKGADIDHQSGRLGNTALHEACLLGPEGKECIAALLRYNASIQKKNKEGQSAYDLALKTGDDQIISLFAAKLSQGILDQHTQPKDVSLGDI
uniref:Double zinc ribbon and ankyrin repeat-containing protein 1 n=1 Tax=Monodelphis domestica TaxID=13616 RepID=A0A5F8GSA7_MONDO